MAEKITMPKMSDTMTEGTIAAWHKKVGDTVKSGDVLAEIETDKATMEFESYSDGVLLYIGVQEKESVAVDALLAIIGKEGEDYKALLGGDAPAEEKKPEAEEKPAQDSAEKQEEKPKEAEKPKEEAATEQPKTDKPAAPAANVNATAVTMPKMSDTMNEGTIAAWHKKVGDKVKSGELLAEVETDKATMELESYEDGTLLYIGVEAGSSVAVDGIIAIIGEEGADYQSLLGGGAAAPKTEEKENTEKSAETSAEKESKPEEKAEASKPAESEGDSNADNRLKASPLARRMAEDKGFDLGQVKGSGENGRIVRRDVEGFKPAAKPASASSSATTPKPAAQASAPTGQVSFEDVPLSQMRKTIARRLGESMYSAPHFYLTMEINMDKAIEMRKSLNDYAQAKISFNDLVLKAVATALRAHPKVNSSWLGDKIRYNHHINIGVAVAVEEGLLVPVVRFADTKSLTQISNEVKDLGGRAKNKQLQPADWEGSTFTISNLGMFGIEEFTAIINPPDACILAVGGIKQVAIVKDNQLVPGNVMKVTMSCDHRAVDGAIGAAFLQTLKALLEDPIRMLA